MSNDARAVREGDVAAWLTSYKTDAPLHSQMPITLQNGKAVPGVHVVCSSCGNRISGDRVRGHVIQSLPHVVTIAANGFCGPCDRLTHIDCRFRATADETVVEWLASNRCWQAKEMRQPTLGEKITEYLRRLLSK